MRPAIVTIILLLLTYLYRMLNAYPIHHEGLAFTVDIPEGFEAHDYLKPHGEETRPLKTLFAWPSRRSCSSR